MRANKRHERIKDKLIKDRFEASLIRKKLDEENRPNVIKEKFMRNVQFEPNTGCWLWDGPLDRDNYARFGIKEKRSSRASRISYEYFKGIDPKEMYVLHKCDTRQCVNPDHLFLGTAKDNAQDCSKKGRHKNQIKTHCHRGHEYTEQNTYSRSPGKRECRICLNERSKCRKTA